uniref:Uncharacterized protein n=1 Tax=Nicotiana tabacum TaxID=4097 RepID=A0A1S3XGT6_TOBAC|nr:PREDICTED: uncharacterized protein LOC107765082 [Nicotiana tabacum]
MCFNVCLLPWRADKKNQRYAIEIGRSGIYSGSQPPKLLGFAAAETKLDRIPGDRRGNRSGRNSIRNEKRSDRGPNNRGLISKSGFDRPIGGREAPRLLEYNFNVDATSIVSAIGRIKETKWPRSLQSDPTQRDPTHGHRTEDCRQLREEVARLFNNGHLWEFLNDRVKNHFRNRDSNKQADQEEPQHVINMIIRGVDVPQGPVIKRTKVSITREKRTRDYILEGAISFSDEDVEGIVQPHNDALVMSILINKSRVKRVLSDPGSSTNIIRSRVVEQLGLEDQTVPAVRVLNGFNMECETTKGEITLLVNTAGTIQDTKFYMIEGDMRYNALFRRPWVQNMGAVPSTLHKGLKFSTPGGIKTVYGEQPAIKEMFSVNKVISVPVLSTSKNTKPTRKE